MKKDSGYTESLRRENETIRLMIRAEFGVDINEDCDLCPSLERILLRKIIEIEKGKSFAQKTTIWDYVGKPEFKPVELIPDEEIFIKLHLIIRLMREKNIVVDSVNDIDDREMYRFITTEFFNKEIDSCLPANVILFYNYEDFYPNDEEDVKTETKTFIESVVSGDDELFNYYFDEIVEEDERINADNIKRKFKYFREAFDKIILEDFIIHSVEVSKKNAEVNFDFRFTVIPAESHNRHTISGPGRIKFVRINTFWYILDVKMNGIL